MKEAFAKIIERLEEKEQRYRDLSVSDKNSGQNHWCIVNNRCAWAINEAIAIVNQVAEEYKNDIVYQTAMLYAIYRDKYGVDITEKWETATQNAYAMEQAYLRGRKDERDRFDKWREECGKDINVSSNDGWITLPKVAFDRMIARMESESERSYDEEPSWFINVRDAARIVFEIAEEYSNSEILNMSEKLTGSDTKKQTNADYIRNMTDEELTNVLLYFDFCDICQPCTAADECICTIEEEKEKVVIWLQEPKGE